MSELAAINLKNIAVNEPPKRQHSVIDFSTESKDDNKVAQVVQLRLPQVVFHIQKKSRLEQLKSRIFSLSRHERNLYLNASIVALATALYSGINILELNNSLIIGSQVNASGDALFVNMICSFFISNILKGNWRNVGSYNKQLQVLFMFLAFTVGCDMAFIRAGIPGEASATGMLTTLSYLSKMSAGALLGQRTFRSGSIGIEGPNPKALNKRKIFYFGLTSAASGLVIAGKHLLGTSNNYSVLLDLFFTKFIGKSGKVMMKTETDRKMQRRAVLKHVILPPLIISVLLGFCFKMDESEYNMGFLQGLDGPKAEIVKQVSAYAYHYFGSVGIIALCKGGALFMKAADDNLLGFNTRPPLVPDVSRKKVIKNSIAFPLLGGAALIGHFLNNRYNYSAAFMGNGLKLVQAELQQAAAAVVFKAAPTKKQKLSTLTASLFIALLYSALTYGLMAVGQIDDSTKSTATSASLATSAITAGVIAIFAAKWMRNELLPKD